MQRLAGSGSSGSSSASSSARAAAEVERMAAQIEAQYPDVRHVRPEQVVAMQQQQQQQQQQRAQLVDVRPPVERAVSVLPGAISLAELERVLEQKQEQQQQGQSPTTPTTYVLYCTIGKRSSDEARRMQRRHPGLPLANLRGSLLAWTHAGLPLEEGATRAHCFARPWALLPDGYEAVVFSPLEAAARAVFGGLERD
jgi:rhodanese-related sulfurtransferase